MDGFNGPECFNGVGWAAASQDGVNDAWAANIPHGAYPKWIKEIGDHG